MKRFQRAWSGIALLSLLMSPPLVAAQTLSISKPNLAVEQKLKSLQAGVLGMRGSYKVGYSSAMDKPISQLCGLKEPEGLLKQAPAERLAVGPLQALPASYDWRALNGTTPVKNQGGCGSCWAFSTAGPMESQIKLQCGITVDLAEQYLVSCNNSGYGCGGGWFAHEYHTNYFDQSRENEPGAVLETSFPYKASNVSCGGPHEHPYRLVTFDDVPGYPQPSVQAIKQAIFNYGPISAAVYVGPKFQAYSSGVFNTNEQDSNPSIRVNHAIVLVGWNDDLGTDNGYWILRNSWGSGWGEDGYMKIRYGISRVGYAANYVQFACSDPPTPPGPEPEPPAPPQPDLTGRFTSVSTARAGLIVSATLRVTNEGDANAAAFRILLYRSSDGTDKTQYLGAVTVRGLAAEGYRDISFRKRSSYNSWSNQSLIAVIDSESQVKESEEDNNTVTARIP